MQDAVVSLNELCTGDLILFSASTTTGDSLIKMATRSEWTHVGVVVCMPDLLEKRGPMLLECGHTFSDDLPDISWKYVKRTSGVRLVDLQARVQLADADRIACRLLRVGEEASCQLDDAHVLSFVNAVAGRRYESSTVELVRSALPGNPVEHTESLFCSELVAYALKYLGVTSRSKSSNSYTPHTFARNFATAPDCDYGDLIELRRGV